MNIGMLWFDNDPKKPLDAKVLQAADYYRHKYGRSPDLCLVNPAILAKTISPGEQLQTGRILIKPLRSIMPDHLWIGVDELPAVAN